MLRERIEGNIGNRNCYCIWIDYDDDNEEEEEEEEEKVQDTRSYSTWLWYYWGTMRFELRLITELALVGTG